jgi:hypothetical protein
LFFKQAQTSPPNLVLRALFFACCAQWNLPVWHSEPSLIGWPTQNIRSKSAAMMEPKDKERQSSSLSVSVVSVEQAEDPSVVIAEPKMPQSVSEE